MCDILLFEAPRVRLIVPQSHGCATNRLLKMSRVEPSQLQPVHGTVGGLSNGPSCEMLAGSAELNPVTDSGSGM
jgi:hypothetical protein